VKLGEVLITSVRCLEPHSLFFLDSLWVKAIYDRDPTEQLGSGSPGQSEALITQAVQKALDAYFVQLDKYRSIGVLQTST
jgi:hypothetical protein